MSGDVTGGGRGTGRAATGGSDGRAWCETGGGTVVIEIAVVLEGWVRWVELTQLLVYLCTYMQNSNTRFKTNAPFEDNSFFIHTCSLAVQQLFPSLPSTCPETVACPKTSTPLHYVDVHVYIDFSKPQLLADTYCRSFISVLSSSL